MDFDQSSVLLSFIHALFDAQYLDGHWITSRGGSVSCDVSEVCGWFYTIFLPDLLKRKDLSDELRAFIKDLID